MARRADRLESLEPELTRAHGVTVTAVAHDLGVPDAVRTLRAELDARGIHATELVDNAGFGTHDAFTDEGPGPAAEHDRVERRRAGRSQPRLHRPAEPHRQRHVATAHADLDLLVDLSQMTVSQLTATTRTAR